MTEAVVDGCDGLAPNRFHARWMTGTDVCPCCGAYPCQCRKADVALDALPVNARRHIDITGECWRWTGSLNRRGYGLAWFAGRNRIAHRMTFESARGQITPGLQIDHLCRNRACVRPDHLEPVTALQNTHRGTSPVMGACPPRAFCAQGHPLTAENTKPRNDGGRRCLTCRAISRKKWRVGFRVRRREAWRANPAALAIAIDALNARKRAARGM